MRKITLAIFMLLVLFCLQSQAVLVHYTDENGEIHYVNPKLTKIPEKYLPQVRSQLESLKTPATVTESKIISSSSPSPQPAAAVPRPGLSPAPKLIIELVVDNQCPACEDLQRALSSRRVPYRRFNIQYDKYAREIIEQQRANPPITKVGNTFIQGNDIAAIMKAREELEELNKPKP